MYIYIYREREIYIYISIYVAGISCKDVPCAGLAGA